MESPIECYRCTASEDKQQNPGLVCEGCRRFLHITCLRSVTTPGNLFGDIFFDFTCSACSPDGEEKLKRNKNSFPWFCVIYLTIQHLTINSYGISNKGFFHYKTHIASFIDRHWMILFEENFKQKKSWIGTLAGQLSMNNGTYFFSGLNDLGEPGWWKLRHLFSPAVAAHISQEFLRDRRNKSHHRNNAINVDKQIFLDTVQQLGYSHLIVDVDQQPKFPFMVKFEPIEHDFEGLEYNESQEMCPVEISNNELFKYECVGDAIVEESMEFMPTNETIPIQYDPEIDPHSSPNHSQEDEYKTIEKTSNNLFSVEDNSTVLPWGCRETSKEKLVLLSEYEEVQLLKKIEGLVDKVKDSNKQAYLRRLKTKLALRRRKRNKHLPVFDFDNTVRKLGGYIDEDIKMNIYGERVLDRFQRSYVMDNLTGTVASTNYGTIILSKTKPECFISPYSGTMLKPFIRRDFESRPLWMRVTEELLLKTNKHNPNYTLPPRSSINYMYVRPHHIAAVNSLCAQYLWPGIDLTESLQYPEFSCVVEYRSVVVGCAFLVPDAKHHEAYLSFVVTRPEWGNNKIASFMLYHLLQTCANQDVTLHVSPTNPAIFLYQKFGFKVEELIHDFYEKYYDINYKGCKHALFLRLVR